MEEIGMEGNASDMNQQIKQMCDGRSSEFSHPCRILIVEEQ
jgi:hypothetical protein